MLGKPQAGRKLIVPQYSIDQNDGHHPLQTITAVEALPGGRRISACSVENNPAERMPCGKAG
jgi:hypothetical protein